MLTKAQIIKKIEYVESKSGTRLKLLCEENGKEQIYTVKEFKQHPEAIFKRCVDGNSLKDLDEFLDYITEVAASE